MDQSTPLIPPVVPILKPNNHVVAKIVAGAVILTIGIGIGLVAGKYLLPAQISSYEECVKANGNQIQTIYPSICTKDGKSFREVLTDEEKKSLQPPDPTANWKTYVYSTIGVEFKYPPDWKITTFPNNSRMILIVSNAVPTDKFGVPNDENSPGYIRIIYYVCEELSTKENVPCDTFEQLTTNTKYDLQPKTIKETAVTVSGKQGAQISGVSKYGGFKKYTFFPAGEFQQSVITYNVDTEAIYDKILSTFKFSDNNMQDIPLPISTLFSQINQKFGLSLIPIEENEFYSPSGMITKKSWKLDFTNTTVGKSLPSFLLEKLNPNNEGGGGGGAGIDGYENGQIKCSHSYGYRSGTPENWSDPYNYLTCTEK